jgi:ABC-type nickel/cobalt efflux system permease component RcnA
MMADVQTSDPFIFALGLGFVLGLKHATEADHLVAVATIVSEQRSVRRSSLVGALWGAGHTAALVAVGLLVLLLRVAIPPRVAALFEFGVALMIVLLGSRVLYFLLRDRRRVHTHTHRHGERVHTHLHFHDERDAHAPSAPHPRRHARHGGLSGLRPVLVGAVHGLAGSAALTLLILTEVVRGGSRALGLTYLLVFGAGSVGGMLLMSTLISLPFALTASRFERINTPIRLAAGLSSVAFGLFYAWQTATASN